MTFVFVKIGTKIINLGDVSHVDLGEAPEDPVTVFLKSNYEDKKTAMLMQAWLKFAGADAEEARRVLDGFTEKPKELKLAGQ